MKLFNLIFLITALISITPHAVASSGSGNVSNVVQLGNSLTVPESNIGSAAGYFTLYGGVSGTATIGNFYVLYRDGVAYHNSNGTTKTYCDQVLVTSGSQGSVYQLVSSTSAFANNSSSALSGGVYQCGAAGNYCMSTGPTAFSYSGLPGSTYVFSNGAYAGFQTGTGGGGSGYSAILICKEQ